MNTMQPAIQAKVMCHACPSRSRSSIAAGDAEKIVQEMESLIRKYSLATHRIEVSGPLLHRAVQCHFTSGGCNHFQLQKSRLERAEHTMSMRFRQICGSIQQLYQESRIQEAKALAEETRIALAGYYPSAATYVARLIQK